ncbi:MAG: YbfB/YjiJ family MFS transporter [Rhodospirillaceae bacterium]|nr:YbfB/YjiJ family MFS transporter [Rhodospirillaceae bacterium]MDD9927408.1 YbfB/YjiJ family MFS transporter [Rhodospirillaceae bacterium]
MPVWLRLAIGGGATLLVGMGIGRFSYTPLIPAIILDGALSEAEAGYVGAFNLGGYLLGALAVPFLRRRYRTLPVLKAALAISLICLVASIFPFGFLWLVWWRGLVGVTVAVLMIYSLALVTTSVPGDRLGKATGVVFTGVGTAILLSGTLVPWLLEHSLAAAWTGLALVGAVGVVLGWWGLSAAREAPEPESHTPPPWEGASTRLVVAQGLFAIGLVPHSIYWVDYVARGLGLGMIEGGVQWVLVGVGAVGGTYLCGWLADRIGFAAALVLVFAVLAVGIAIPVLFPGALVLVASSLIFGAQPGLSAVISGRARQVVGARDMPHVWRRMVLSVGLSQTVGGYLLVALFNATGSYTAVFLIGGGAMALGAVLSLPVWGGKVKSPVP